MTTEPQTDAPVPPAAAPAATASSGPATIVADLVESQAVDGIFAVVRSERLLTRNGQPYLNLMLRDRSGSIPGRVFRDADALRARFADGDAVRVRGRVERYRDALQLDVQQLVRAEGVDPTLLLPTAYRDVDELEGFLEHLAREVHDAGLQALLLSVLGDPKLREALRTAPCSRGGHHAYLGGLLEHTVAVAQLSWELCQLHPRLDRDLLVTAAIVHDLGKIREFTYAGSIELSDEGRMLGHVELGLQILAAHRPPSLGDDRWLSLTHCVLTHHGPEVTPTRQFQSYEALALFRVNAVDAQLKFAFEHGL
ncbi:MAG: HD domain-containing protein [Solirubrobacteraceae bacterium]|nr:HD domain-containing protein [Solirubrobacteraceae bacterium]